MQRKMTPAWLALALGTGVTLGCQTGAEQHSYSGDPVLLSKKPVDGKPDPAAAAPVLLAHAEPAEPAMPTAALAASPPSLTPAVKPDAGTAASAGMPAAVDSAPMLTAVPTSQAVAPMPTQTAVLRRVDGPFGHGPDYGWLQGVLDKHYLGYMTLRYCDYGTDDRWGGKVILDEDPRLAMFHDGDVVQVEGALVEVARRAAKEPWEQFPHYRIRVIQLVKPGGQ